MKNMELEKLFGNQTNKEMSAECRQAQLDEARKKAFGNNNN
jgi:hypothetical protein